MHRLRVAVGTGLVLALTATAALAAAPPTTMPSQESSDAPAPGSTSTNATWSDLPGGLAARPYVKSLAVVNGDARTTVFSGGIDAAKNVRAGDVTAVVSPFNLCRAGQTPSPGQCYATPNRVGITFGYRTDQGLDIDLARPSVPANQSVSASTVLDVVIGLNTLGTTLRWSWVNGQLVSWKTTGLGTDGAEIHLRVRPSETPNIDWSTRGPVGCTATPIRDCDVAQADGEYLGSGLVLSLDETLDRALTGAAFATQGAIAGYLVPGGSSAAPTLDMQIASSHLKSDGQLQRGVLQAFLPAGALTTLYGVVPADAAAFFTTTRRGDAGTNGAPTFDARRESADESAGLMITIDQISFSAPTYRVTRKTTTLRARSSVRAGVVTVSSRSAIARCRSKACTATVYRIAKGLTGKATKVASARSTAGGGVTVRVPRAKLAKGATYVLSVRKAGKPLASTRGRSA